MTQFSKKDLMALTKAQLVDLAKERRIAVSRALLKTQMVQIIDAALKRQRRAASRVFALLKDPHWVYCFWDLDPDQKKEALRKLGCSEPEATTILRVWDQTGAGFDIEPGPGKDNYYVRLDEGKRYFFEIGLRSPRGEFCPLARSDSIQTPEFFPLPRLETAALPQKRTFTEEEFLRIYALAYGLDHYALPGEIVETLRSVPAVTSPGIFSSGAARKF